MKYLIWGTGPYCREKIDRFKEDEIVGFVEREKMNYRGRETILPSEIADFNYDYIVVLSSHYQDIIFEMVQMGIEYKKIIPGINCKPYLFSELEYISERGRVAVTPNGELEYIYKEDSIIKINGKKSWEQIRKYICSEENAALIKNMDIRPVGKKYGSDRGGSICRYYLDQFLREQKKVISGKVLEIGDRNYTEKFGNAVTSYVLHFDDTHEETEFDFKGDLRTGEGIEENFYDCIICTQVLDFVQDLTKTPDVLINSLKIGGKLLVSVSGISTICRYDMEKYGQYWNFTDKSLKNMFTSNSTECEVWTKGNCKVACAFLQGMGYTELTAQELEETDEDFQVVIFAVVTRIK
ncbi:MAG: class I SAM-dependent methyltransferase [Lachnospiraceae bacterium]|nr:class I SAM-dependent methyltransferase [Lachnospiraceae bacterium]